MQYWLIKSEPSVYSFDQLQKDGKSGWEGVRNFQARNNLRAMKKGDILLYYHSNEGKEIVGEAKVMKTAYQDPTSEDPNWVTIDIAPVKKFNKTIALDFIKKDTLLQNMALIKQSRLSVMPVTEDEYLYIKKISG